MVEIRNMHAFRTSAVLTESRDGVSAQVVLPHHLLAVSRLEGETDWTIDGKWLTNGFPIWWNGAGARYLRTAVVQNADILAALDAAVAAQTGA